MEKALNDSDSEFEEEEIIIFADFKNNIIPSELKDTKTLIKIIGIYSDNPIAEVNGNIFKGKYDYSMGTHIFFEEDDNPPTVDPIYDKCAKQNFKYFAKTNKVLNFSRIFVEPQTNSSGPAPENQSTKGKNEKNPLQVDITYEEALQQLKQTANL